MCHQKEHHPTCTCACEISTFFQHPSIALLVTLKFKAGQVNTLLWRIDLLVFQGLRSMELASMAVSMVTVVTSA